MTTMIAIDTKEVRRLKEETGVGMKGCFNALLLTKGNSRVAKEFLKLTSQAFSRKKKNELGEVIPWDTEDYLEEAYRVSEEDLV